MPWEESTTPEWMEVGNVRGPAGADGEEGPPGPPANQESLDAFLAMFQPKAPVLSSLSQLAYAADRLAYFTGTDGQVALAAFTAFARSLFGAGNAGAARTALDVFSKTETTAQAVPTALLGSARIETEVAVPGNATLGATAGYAPGLGVAVNGDGRPALVHVHISSIRWPESVVYAYLNYNDAMKVSNQSKAVPNTNPGNTVTLTYLTPPLTAGQQHRFDVGFRTTGGKAGTIVASPEYQTLLVVHRV